ncbi:MAG: serine hydrolase domain-containing protein [Bacteroidota bacterium]
MERMISIIINMISGLFLIPQPAFAQLNSTTDQELLALKGDSILEVAVNIQEHMGITAGIMSEGELLWKNGAGWSDEDASIPAEADMVHRIASISKPMTSIAILQLYEQGKIDLDAPIHTYIPEYPKHEKGTFTVRQLLTHTSGTNHYKGGTDGFSVKNYPTLNDAMKRFWERKLVAEPGTMYRYTTYGYVVLGVVIERVSGMEYEAYMKKHVWEPAGMKNTSIERKGVTVANSSKLYKRTDKGELKKDLKTNLSMKTPGGGILSTTNDLLKFGQAILDHKLIKEETFELMATRSGLKKQGNPYGMGWFLYKDETDRRGRIIGHSGSQSGTSSQLMILLDAKIVVAVMSNTRRAWNELFMTSWNLINRSFSADDLQAPIKQVVSLKPAEMDRFLGTYDFGQGQIMKITRKGDQLYSQMNKYPPIMLYPESKEVIGYRAFDAYFDFEFDASGAYSKMTYWQNGQEVLPKKIE